MKKILIVFLFVLFSCSITPASKRPDYLPNKKLYTIVLVTGNNTGHDKQIEIKAMFHSSVYESEVFDGSKTPLIYLELYNRGYDGWYWHLIEKKWRFASYGTQRQMVFEGLVEAFYIKEEE